MIYIQSDSDRALPHHFDCSCALYGAVDSAMDYRLTSFEEVQSGKFDMVIKQNLFVGSVEFMREVFSRIGLTDVRVPKNSDRAHEIMTLAEAHERISDGSKLFVKPVEIKLFTGLILDGCVHSCLENLPDDTQVMAYVPFEGEIITEWRVYVHRHEAIDGRNYSGEWEKHIDMQHLNRVIEDNRATFPCAYTIDIGVIKVKHPMGHPLAFYDNVVVEFNDMWAIGNYGLENDRYLRLLKERYFEIVRS
jgi:ATP-grasp domain, R2K clade family 2